ncbi:MAG: nuclear transport factor 2 family protein [Xanthomonadaceae bacterium]|nr:nuclear transport factor 2 family protein [Xanthomonadaceae bacterium]
MSNNVRTVERFIAAFNAHDSGAMGALVADDVAWLNITGEDVTVVVKGKSELVASMNDYFEACPTCQSVLFGTISTPDRISAIEIASWQGTTGLRSQRSISVYEFSESLIQRVYYFPSEN